MWQWDRADLAEAKTADEAAIVAAQTKADALGAKLTAAEAKAAAITQQTVTKYVTQIQTDPDDAARNRDGSLGVRAIIGGGLPEGPSGPSAGVPGPAIGSGPK
jgi:hypothetical protein